MTDEEIKLIENLINVRLTQYERENQQLKAEVKRLKYRLNHQTEEDMANCKAGRHGDDCGK